MQASQLKGNNGPRYRHLADESAPYATIRVDKLTPIIGAEIDGIDLAQPLEGAQLQEVHRALAENSVIFFRDQHVSRAQHLAFGRLFGDLHVHPAAPHEPGLPEMMIIHADRDSPRANGEGWHTDVSCELEPPMGSILYMKELPPDNGGNTLFANMYRAFETLSAPIQKLCEGLVAVHDGAQIYGGRFGRTPPPGKSFPRSEHPVVRTHPVTGRKALYVNRNFTTHIVGLRKHESDALLEMLYRHSETPEFQCRFAWQPNSVAFWDNRSAMHHAMWDYFPHGRLGYRVTVAGDKPFLRA